MNVQIIGVQDHSSKKKKKNWSTRPMDRIFGSFKEKEV